jgi:hypothetical protein
MNGRLAAWAKSNYKNSWKGIVWLATIDELKNEIGAIDDEANGELA